MQRSAHSATPSSGGERSDSHARVEPLRRAQAANHTGLPDTLRAGIESLSGISMDGVNVQTNSALPEQIGAYAYTQGSDIHVAPGQDKHLPHEAWHVVQQAQGRVRPTMQLKGGVQVNDTDGLEREADVMGARALSAGRRQSELRSGAPDPRGRGVVQRYELKPFEKSNAEALVKQNEAGWPDGADDMIAWAKSWKQFVTIIANYTHTQWTEIQDLFPDSDSVPTKKESIDAAFKVADREEPLKNGVLKQWAIDESTEIIAGVQLGATTAAVLLAIDNDISHWGKYTTKMFDGGIGDRDKDYQVHFYYNTATREVCTSRDYKKKFRDQSQEDI